MTTKATSKAKLKTAAGSGQQANVFIQIGIPAAGVQIPVMPGGTITVSGDATPGQTVAVSLVNNTTGASVGAQTTSDGATGAWSVSLKIADPSQWPGTSALAAQVDDGPTANRNILIVAAMPMPQMKRKSKPKVKPR